MEVHTRRGILKRELHIEEIHIQEIYIHGGEILTEEVNIERRYTQESATQRKLDIEGAHTPNTKRAYCAHA